MHLFSVIVPHYNSVFLLKHLIDSIPVEDSIQLIVVDDRSTEDISEAEHLVTARGGLFLHNTTGKKGAGTCRNLGLEHADGKWFVFADADDFFLDNAFGVMKRHAYSDADIIHFIPTSMNLETGKASTRHTWCEKLVRRYLAEPTEENELMLRYRFMVPWSKMFRNQMVKDHGIMFDEVMAANDIMFSARCGYYAKTVEAFPEKIYCVTRSEGTLTTRHDEEIYWSRAVIHKNKYNFLAKHFNLKKYGYVVPMGFRILSNAARQGYSAAFIFKMYHYFRQEKVTLINIASICYSFRHLVKERGIK